MALPWEIGSFTSRVYASVEPLAGPDESLGWPLLVFIDAIGRMYQPIADLAEDGDDGEPGWSIVLDVNRIPNEGLPWLAQFVGTQLTSGGTDDEHRQEIRNKKNWQRGTVRALREAAQSSPDLTGTKTVQIRERDTSPYHFTVVTFGTETIENDLTYLGLYDDLATYDDLYGLYGTYETPWLDGSGISNDVLARLLKQKPAGLQMDYIVQTYIDYYNIFTDYAIYQDVYDGFASYEDLYQMTPTGPGSTGEPLPDDAMFSLATYQDVWNGQETYQDVLSEFATY